MMEEGSEDIGVNLKRECEISIGLMEDPDTRLPAAQRLLLLLTSNVGTYAIEDAKRALRIVARNVFSPPVELLDDVLQLLEMCQSCEETELALAIVDILPELIGEGSSILIQTTFEHLMSMLDYDRSYLVPVIGCLAAMSLNEKQRIQLFTITKASLRVVEESDVPAVVRALLRATDARCADQVAALVRRYSQSSTLCLSTRSLVYTIVTEAVQLRSTAANAFLKAIEDALVGIVNEGSAAADDNDDDANGKRSHQRDIKSAKLVTLDLVVLVALISKRHSRASAIRVVHAMAQSMLVNSSVVVKLSKRVPVLHRQYAVDANKSAMQLGSIGAYRNEEDRSSMHVGLPSKNSARQQIFDFLDFLRILMHAAPSLPRRESVYLRATLVEAYHNIYARLVYARSTVLAEMLRFVSVTHEDALDGMTNEAIDSRATTKRKSAPVRTWGMAERQRRCRRYLLTIASRVGSAVLLRIASNGLSMLRSHASHIVDALQRVFSAYERASERHIHRYAAVAMMTSLHRLCAVRTYVASDLGRSSQMLIGVQKRLFFGGDAGSGLRRRETGLLIASHLMRSSSLPPLEQSSLARWIFDMLPRDVSQTPTLGNHEMLGVYVLALDALSQATSRLGRRLRSELLERHLRMLTQKIARYPRRDATNGGNDDDNDDDDDDAAFVVLRSFGSRADASTLHLDVATCASLSTHPRYVAALCRCFLRHENDPAHNPNSKLSNLNHIAYVVPKYLADMIRNEDAHSLLNKLGAKDGDFVLSCAYMLSSIAAAVSVSIHEHNEASSESFEADVWHYWLACDANRIALKCEAARVAAKDGTEETPREKYTPPPVSPKIFLKAVAALPSPSSVEVMQRSRDVATHCPSVHLKIELFSELVRMLGTNSEASKRRKKANRIDMFGAFCCDAFDSTMYATNGYLSSSVSTSPPVVTAREALRVADVTTDVLPCFQSRVEDDRFELWTSIASTVSCEARHYLFSPSTSSNLSVQDLQKRNILSGLVLRVMLVLLRRCSESRGGSAGERTAFVLSCASSSRSLSSAEQELEKDVSDALRRTSDGVNALLLAELLVEIATSRRGGGDENRQLSGPSLKSFVKSIMSAHTHATSETLYLVPNIRTDPSRLVVNSIAEDSVSWAMMTKQVVSTAHAIDTWASALRVANNLNYVHKSAIGARALSHRARLYPTAHFLLLLFGGSVLSGVDSNEVIQLLVADMEHFVERQLAGPVKRARGSDDYDDAAREGTADDVHPNVRSMSLDSFGVFFEALMYSSVCCMWRSAPTETPIRADDTREEGRDWTSGPYDSVIAVLFAASRLLSFVVTEFQRSSGSSKTLTFLHNKSATHALLASELLCIALQKKVASCLVWRTRDRRNSSSPLFSVKMLRPLFLSAMQFLDVVECVCHEIKSGNARINETEDDARATFASKKKKKKRKRRKKRSSWASTGATKHVPRIVMALERCRSYLRQSATELRMPDVSSESENLPPRSHFLPLSYNMAHAVARSSKDSFGLSEWIGSVRASSRERKEARNGDYGKAGSRSKASQLPLPAVVENSGFEAVLHKSPTAKARRIHRFSD
eukprot:g606.t1